MVDYRIHQVLKAMGEPTRIRLLNLLRIGDICVCDLQAVLRVSQSNVSRHLAALRHVGLVACSRKGLRIIYSLAPPSTPQMAALHDLLRRCCSLEPALQQDIERFRQAVAGGECRLESLSSPAENGAARGSAGRGKPLAAAATHPRAGRGQSDARSDG